MRSASFRLSTGKIWAHSDYLLFIVSHLQNMAKNSRSAHKVSMNRLVMLWGSHGTNFKSDRVVEAWELVNFLKIVNKSKQAWKFSKSPKLVGAPCKCAQAWGRPKKLSKAVKIPEPPLICAQSFQGSTKKSLSLKSGSSTSRMRPRSKRLIKIWLSLARSKVPPLKCALERRLGEENF